MKNLGFKYGSSTADLTDIGRQFATRDQFERNQVYTWGQSSNTPYGGTQTGHTVNQSSPVKLTTDPVIDVAISGFTGGHGAYIKDNGTLWVWGRNDRGNLGTGNTTSLSTPTQVGSGTTWSKVWVPTYQDDAWFQRMFVLKNDGTLWGAGVNYHGVLGLGSTNVNDANAGISTLTQIGTDRDWKEIFPTAFGTWALKSDGSLWYTGDAYDITNAYGVGASQTTTFTKLSDGPYKWLSGYSRRHILLDFDGNLHQITTGSDGVFKTSPLSVGGVDKFQKIVGNYLFSFYGLQKDGTLWSWTLPYATPETVTSAQQVGTDKDWINIFETAGYDGIAATKTNGSLYKTQGYGTYYLGQPGLVTTQDWSTNFYGVTKAIFGSSAAIVMRSGL